MEDPLSLADWRRQISEIYAEVRKAPIAGRHVAWQDWRAAGNELLKNHPQSPLDAGQRSQFRGLPYFAYEPKCRVVGTFEPADLEKLVELDLGNEGSIILIQVGQVKFTLLEHSAFLNAYWIEGYGGGLFIPFRVLSNGVTSYGGGRYLFDTIKGADLGTNRNEVNMDFNYRYNPSCAYHQQWICPLPPHDNSLSFSVTAGEKFHSS
ncbi:MAG TPA: DUF1684 domain-containing protein [candidate division Zixibacteria bacterium]|nr:DUF1684 domain-containing protein [candidate division Zixibacteria bacterium]